MKQIVIVGKTCKVDMLSRNTPRYYVEYAVSVGSWDNVQVLEVTKDVWDTIVPGGDYQFSLSPAPSTTPVYPEERVAIRPRRAG